MHSRDTVTSDPNLPSADYQVLLHAISSCSSVAVKQLLNLDPKLVNVKGWHGQTPLHRACLTGDNEMVQLILDYGGDPNGLNDFGESPVHYASKRGMPPLLHTLYLHGGKLDILDKKRKSPIHDAAQTGSVYMLQYFAERGFGFRDVDDNLQTPLHHACSFGHLEAFKFLMRNGRSDPSVKDIDGNTPLHICAREGYGHGSWTLINYLGLGSLHVQNNDGYTPLDLCKQHDRPSNQILVLELEKLVKQPTSASVRGPIWLWYYQLLMPTVAYFLAVMLTLIMSEKKGIVILLVLANIIRVSRNASHRITHCSRWASPLFAGLFAAGVFHTMLVYYAHIINHISEYSVLIIVSKILNVFHLYLYWKLLRADPGEVRTGEINDATHKPATLTDLCQTGGLIDRFCVTCEIVQSGETKHCKLCEKCFYKMDHHCLFLLKCIGYNNHTRFVWFIIITVIIMFIFLLQVIFLYIPVVYPDYPYRETIYDMFWKDGWVLSMSILNVGSIVWAVMLIQFQLKVVSKGQTTYFQGKSGTSMLTPMERILNIIYFLQGKEPYAKDFMFDDPKKACCSHDRSDSRHSGSGHIHEV